MTVERLETERLELAKPKPSDWPAFRDFYMFERADYIRDPEPNLGKAWRTLASEIGHWDMRGYGMFSVYEKGSDTPIGLVGPWYPADWPETEIGWMVFDGSEGKGIAYEAASACIHHAWHDLKWDRMVSYVDPKNERSIALAERLGATPDPSATQQKPDLPCVVYRHPKPEGLQ